MPVVSVRIPMIGEGLQEARLVAVLKKPGDKIRRDEPIYQMETDKAVMDVESPYEGTLLSWSADPDTILAIGAEIAQMEVGDAVETAASAPTPAPPQAADTSGDSVISLNIPMMGEGLQEARLVATLKNPGDPIKRDEAIYQMETDKAIMDVESPYSGVLVEWTANVDDVLPIGAEVGKIKVAGATPVTAPSPHGPPKSTPVASAPAAQTSRSSGNRRIDIPPRTRAYAKQKGLTEDQLNSIVGKGSKLMPEDVDAFLGGQAKDGYQEVAMNQKQRLLSSRLQRGSQLVVPGTIMVEANWEGIESVRANYKNTGGEFQPSSFTMFAFAVAQALKDFPSFRSTLVGDSTIRTYDHAQLGIAVALPGDELVLAVVDKADHLDWVSFANTLRCQIDLAREGKDQATEATTISLTNMQAFGLRDAVPVVVPPGVGTLFLGEPHKAIDQSSDTLKTRTVVILSLTFDHRLINGVGASEFINRVKHNVENIQELIQL